MVSDAEQTVGAMAKTGEGLPNFVSAKNPFPQSENKHVFTGWHIDDLRLYFECHHAGARAHQHRQENLANKTVTYNDIVFELVASTKIKNMRETLNKLLANVRVVWGRDETPQSAISAAHDIFAQTTDSPDVIRSVNGVTVNYFIANKTLCMNFFHSVLIANEADLLMRNELMELCDSEGVAKYQIETMGRFPRTSNAINFLFTAPEFTHDGEIKTGKKIGRQCNFCAIKNCEFNNNA